VGTLSPWQPRQVDLQQGVEEVLQTARALLVGSWHGVVTTPWTAPYSYSVQASFDVWGGYSAHCVQNSDYDGVGCCRAFYYGSDRDTPIKQWRLSGVSQNGAVSGSIDIAFEYDSGFDYPAWQGQLRGLVHDASGNRVRFEFWRDDGYGPVAFDLERN
jgi:hypothetical protein